MFDSVCRNHNLKYFLGFGTLLGAVRHHGFVPWDDDIDIFMFRDDYEKFLKLSNEINSPYFLQTPYTDPGYYYTYAKIRNSNTTGLTTNFAYQNINWGMMLDIYPLDNNIIEDAQLRYDKVSKLAMDNSNYMRKSNPNPSEKDRERIAMYSGRDPIDNYEEIQQIATQFNSEETDYLSISVLTNYKLERNLFLRSSFSNAVLCEFEGYRFPIPGGFDHVLNVLYPNYLELPPIEQRGVWHDNVIFDPEKSYIEYKKKLSK